MTGLWIRLCKKLCITRNMFKRKSQAPLHKLHLDIVPGHVLINFFNSNNEVVDLIYSDSLFHMCAPKVLKLLFPNFVVFWVLMYMLYFWRVSYETYLSWKISLNYLVFWKLHKLFYEVFRSPFILMWIFQKV